MRQVRIMKLKLQHFITVFRTRDEAFIGEVDLTEREFERIRSLLGCAKDDPMVFAYPIRKHVLRRLPSSVSSKLPNGKFDFFLDCGRS